MILGVAEDFSSNVSMDSELKGVPTSGMFLNSGVHPSITLDNLLNFLPSLDVTPAAWNNATAYEVYTTSRNRIDLVTKTSKIYQSIKAGTNQDPEAEDSEYWLLTNISSLRIKTFILQVQDRVYSDLRITNRIVDNHYLYEVGENTINLSNDYAAWVFEPKGSDYLSIRINEISLQKKSTDPISLYVINQGVLIDTLTITPSNGIVEFKRLDYTFKGKGKWIFAIAATDVESSNLSVDPLKYKGFVAYTATGIGATPEDAEYSFQTNGNGLGFNITSFINSETYILNNMSEFGNFIRATLEYMVFTMFLHNSSNREGLQKRIQMNEQLLLGELKELKADTVVKRYMTEKELSIDILERSFDNQLGFDEFEVELGTY
jgi:hypothetical protein